MNAQEIHDLNHSVVAVRRQVVDLATTVARILHQTFQTAHRCTLPHSALLGHISHAIHRAEPDNVIQVYIVTDKPFFSRISIDNTNKSVAVLAEVIQERRILTELVCVGRIITWGVVVTENENESISDFPTQQFASVYVCFFREKHIFVLFFVFIWGKDKQNP